MRALSRPFSLLLLAAFTLLSGCAALQDVAKVMKPEASVADVSVADLSLQSITLLVDVKVDNPNAFALNTSGFDLDLDIAGSTLANVKQPDSKMSIPAQGSNHMKLPVTLAFKDLYSAVSGAAGKNSVPYGIKGNVKLNLPVLGDVSLPLSFEDILPIPKMPDIKLNNIRLDSASLSGIKLNMDMEVTNPNSFGLTVNSLGYALKAAGKSLGSGNMQSLNIGEGESKVVSVPLSLSLSELGMSLYKMLTGSDAVKFALQGNADIAPDLGVWKPEAFSFNSEKSVSF